MLLWTHRKDEKLMKHTLKVLMGSIVVHAMIAACSGTNTVSVAEAEGAGGSGEVHTMVLIDCNQEDGHPYVTIEDGGPMRLAVPADELYAACEVTPVYAD
jgi:hypothetical protein